MRSEINAFALLGAAAALGFALSAAADEERAKGSGQLGADQWVPSISLISILTIQNWSGTVESEICRGCTLPSPMSENLRDPAAGSDTDVTPFVGGSFELMTPELELPGSPRLFVGGEVVATFGSDRRLAQEGDPGEVLSPLPPGNEDVAYRQEAALGQGSLTEAKLGTPMYGAYAGVSFPFQFKGRQLRIKPSISWIRYDVGITGEIVSVSCAPSAPTTNCNENSPGGFQREMRLEASETATFDGIGPGLQLEVDTPKLGPIGSALFLGARAYHVLGDREIKLSDSRSYDDILGTDDTAARWSFETDPWLFRVDIGIRFQWIGLK